MAAHPHSPGDPGPASFGSLPLGQSPLTRSKNRCSHLSVPLTIGFKCHQPSLAPLLLQLIITLLKSTCICNLKSEYTVALLENALAFPQEVH